jgi:hypothetical protein
MKTIMVNGVERNIEKTSVTLRELMDDVNSSLAADSRIISVVRVDGAEMTPADQEKAQNVTVESLGMIEFMAASPTELAMETLTTLEQYLDRIIQNIDRAGNLYKSKNYMAADGYFMKTVDGMDLFVQTMSGIKAAMKVGMNAKVALAEATLISIMNDLLDAKKQNNYVMLSELLLQDLVENMKEWKGTVFPSIRERAGS